MLFIKYFTNFAKNFFNANFNAIVRQWDGYPPLKYINIVKLVQLDIIDTFNFS